MKNKKHESVCRWWMSYIKRALTSALLWLLCAAMLIGSLPMTLPVYAQEAPCTQEAHSHGEDCYVQVTANTITKMICSVDADVIVHRHTDFCYDEAGGLRCTLEEKEVHTHGEACLDDAQSLICQKEVLELHTHEAGCYDEEGVLVCEKAQVVEHTHTEACFREESVPVDSEGLTCTVTDETHEHGKLCYGTWVLDCDQPEHTHTEACGIGTTGDQGTEPSTDATEAQIMPEYRAVAPEQSDAGKVNYREELDGDFVYISNLSVSSNDGSYPLDTDDSRGNDSSFNNGILRTYDTATYTINLQTHLCENLDDNFTGYGKGRLHYEFILPFSESEARFEVDSMGWMVANLGAVYTLRTEKTADGKTIQVLRGSFLLGGGTESDPSTIVGEGALDLYAVVRALTVPNGTVLQPYFTIWMEHNRDFDGEEIGYTADANPVHTGLITKLDGGAGEPEGETHFHTPQTCVGEAITITAAPRYNISLVKTQTNVNASRGKYDFSAAGNEKAPNFGCGAVDGRLYGFGITIELWGGETAKNQEGKDVPKGLLGVELPTGDITLTIALETLVNRYDGKGYVSVTDTYRPLVWSGGENEEKPLVEQNSTEGTSRDPDWDTEREVDVDIKDIYSIPINWRLRKNQAEPHRGYCYDGGNWSVGVDDTDGDGDGINLNEVTVTVSGYQIDFKQMPSSSMREAAYKYYDPGVVQNDFWRIEHGVFSAGELWVVMPYTYTAAEGEAVDLRETCAEGMTLLRAWITGGSIGDHSFDYTDAAIESAANMDLGDDKAEYTDPFTKRGDIVVRAMYLEPGGTNNSQPLTKNCKKNQNDWAIAGQRVTLVAEYYQTNKEDGNRVAGMDLLLKFDDAFFDPTGYRKVSLKPFDEPILWAAKPDKTGWNHGGFNPNEEGYDREQREATPEDLIYFTSLDELKAQGYTCVGALMQRRSIIGEGMNYYHMILDGYVKKDVPVGYTYLLTYDCRCWSLTTLHNLVKDKETLPEGMSPFNQSYDDQYSGYAAKYLPQWHTQTAEAAAQPGYQWIRYDEDLQTCFLKTWERTTSSNGNPNKDPNGNIIDSVFQTTVKTIYNGSSPVLGSGAPEYIDACLVVPYALNIDKTTVQTNADGTAKTKYELGLNQEYVDYKLTPTATRVMGAGEAGEGAEQTITVEIVDVLPLGMTLVDKSVYWTGQGENQAFSYTQHPAWRGPGEISGGIAPTDQGSGTEQWFEVKYTLLKEGPYAEQWEIRITLHNVVLTANENTSFGEIYYTGKIRNDLAGGTKLENTARIWSGDDIRIQNAENGNLSSLSIEVLKNSATFLSKGADEPYVEWYDSIGFTMNIGNNSGNDMRNVLIMDSMPVNGVDGSKFAGALVVTEFTAAMSKGDSRLKVGEYLSFYYTTSMDIAGFMDGEKLRAESMTASDLADGTVWTKLEPMDAASTQLTFRLPDGQAESGQITAIAACGSIPAGYTLNLHSTVELPVGQANDYLVNYLSMNNGLYSNAYVRVVSRSLSGKAWYDGDSRNQENVDHLFGAGDELLNGVKVELLQKNSSGEYVPFCYQDTLDRGEPVPVVIQTGQKVSVRDSTSGEAYETGEYQFRDLPPGDFAVRFSSGDKSIYAFTACNQNMGDDAIDSDGTPVYDSQLGNGLHYTVISDIVMPEANSDEMESAFGEYGSQNNDSGFYLTRYELPLTGGVGTTIYYILGAVLTLPALAGLRRRRKH